MAKDQLLALTVDVARLLAAGAQAAGRSDTLHKWGQTSRELAQKVVAVKPVADALDRVLQAPPEGAVAAFLDLVSLARQLRAGLSSAGVAGDLIPFPASGPWQTTTHIRDLHALEDALGSKGSKRIPLVQDALEQLPGGDLRLVAPLIQVLDDKNTAIADLVADRAVPALGPGVVPDLLAELDLKGGVADARRLQIICRLAPAVGADLCRQVVKDGPAVLRVRGLQCLLEVAPPAEVEQVALRLLSHRAAEVRLAALLALRVGRSDEALERALEAARGEGLLAEFSPNAAEVLAAIPHPQTTPRLLRWLQEERAALGELALAAEGTAASLQVTHEKEKRIWQIKYLLNVIGGRQDGRDTGAARTLLPLLTDGETEIRHATLLALGSVGADVPEVLPALWAAVHKEDKKGGPTVALRALRCLPAAQRAYLLPELLKLVHSTEVDHAGWREILLMLPDHLNQERDAILHILREALQSRVQATHNTALEAVAACGPAARETVSCVLDICQWGIRYHAEFGKVLRAIDPEGQEAIPQLLDLLRTGDVGTRYNACAAVAAFGTRAKAAIPDVAVLVHSGFFDMQSQARTTLDALEGKKRPPD